MSKTEPQIRIYPMQADPIATHAQSRPVSMQTYRRRILSGLVCLALLGVITLPGSHVSPATALSTSVESLKQISGLASSRTPSWRTASANASAVAALHQTSLTTIPKRIWQLSFYEHAPNDDMVHRMSSWATVNPDATYSRLSTPGAVSYVQEHFQDRPDLVRLYSNLKTPVLAADLARYLILARHGGYYADLDVTAVKPVKQWVPEDMLDKARVVIGLEYDRGNDDELIEGAKFDVQFCQWSLASAPDHPLLWHVVNTVSKSIYQLAQRQHLTIAEIEPNMEDVFGTTGPVVFTKLVFDFLSKQSGRTITATDLTGLSEPTLFGDILVYPIDGFNGYVGHSNAGHHPEYRLVEHGFAGSCECFFPRSSSLC